MYDILANKSKYIGGNMKVDFLSKKNFVINKKELLTDDDFGLIANLISMAYRSYGIDVVWTTDEVKEIINNPNIYEYPNKDGKVELRIISLKFRLKVEFLFD
jgi:hypothetical protein